MRHYNAYSAYLKKRFRQPVLKLPLNGGFDCPNRDGTKSRRGCAFCDNRAFSPVAGAVAPPLEQLRESMRRAAGRYNAFIAYLQPFSNTYGSAARLRSVYEPLIGVPGVVGLSIGTRPDCLSDEVCGCLREVAGRTYLCVELGLQSSHDATLTLINRGHSFREFAAAAVKLADMHIETAAHVILGLPGESAHMMFETASQCACLPLNGIKIHQLMVIRGTPMERMLAEGKVRALTLKEYAPLVCGFLERLRPDQLIHRIMSDCRKENGLLEPEWSAGKQASIRFLHEHMDKNGVMQGSRCMYGGFPIKNPAES
jgi:radical SAM protein (TIGR01212 family)